jgi:hypothetical protein
MPDKLHVVCSYLEFVLNPLGYAKAVVRGSLLLFLSSFTEAGWVMICDFWKYPAASF